MPTHTKPLKELYDNLTTDREQYLQRARDNASLTIPRLYANLGHPEGGAFQDPFQSVGARGVASMVSQLLLALFPPGLRFFGYDIDPVLKRQAEAEGQLEEFEADRDQRERILQHAIEAPGFRVRMAEALRHLAVAGTCGLQRRTRGRGYRIWRLDQLVAEFDGEDFMLNAVTVERIHRSRLSNESQAAIAGKNSDEDVLDLYTGWLIDVTGKYQNFQEVEEVKLPDTEGGPYTEETIPFQISRFEPCCGEAYGGSMVERVIGDLASLEGTQMSIVELGAEAARIIYLVDPAGSTRAADLEKAPNGSFRSGRKDEVSLLTVDKLQDLQIVSSIATTLRNDLKEAFFDRTAVQRDAERVTAAEVLTVAEAIDRTEGGTYSAMSEELQLPVLRMEVAELERTGKLNKPKGDPIQSRILAGLEGLGRAIELGQYSDFLARSRVLPQDAETGFEVDRRRLLEKLARAAGIDPAEILRKPEVAKKLREDFARAQQQAALGPDLVRQGGQLVQGALQNGRS